METKDTKSSAHPRITVGLPDVSDQIRMINRAAATATEQDQGRWEDLKNLLGELYSQLQRQDRVTVYRHAKKGVSKPPVDRT